MLPSRRALENSVVSFPPENSVGPGPLVFDIVRGPLLPPRGTKERDRILRIFDQNDYASNWQGATSGILKKASQTRIQINGPATEVQYYQDLIGTAHFGHGWEYNVKLGGRDYLSQSYGWIEEIAGPGDPASPLLEAPTGINHLDSGRCYVTGNPIYPILYYSLWDGRMHKMHASRVYMMTDDPNPDERYYGIGRSALERAIAIVQREIRMGQYIDTALDDKPEPGLLSLTGVSRNDWNLWLERYLRDQQNDERPVFGRTLVMTSLDPNAKVQAESIPFSRTPDKFDWIKYMDADLTNYALAIGVDRQELAELSGKALGSGSQSKTLASKSVGKFYGDFYAQISRFLNWAILPDDCEATVVEDDNQEKEAIAQIDTQYSAIASSLNGIGVPTEAIMKMLAAVSPTFEQAFTDEQGNLIALPKAQPELAVGGQPQASQNTGVDNSTPVPDSTTTKAGYSSSQPRDDQGEWSGGGINPAALRSFAQSVGRGQTSTSTPPRPLAPQLSPERQARRDELHAQELGRNPRRSEASLNAYANVLESAEHNRASQVLDAYYKSKFGATSKQYQFWFKAASNQDDAPAMSPEDDALLDDVWDNIDFEDTDTPTDDTEVAKAYSATSADFATRFEDIVSRAIEGRIRRNQAENLLLGLLNSAGEKAFADGLADGGVFDALDDADQARIQDWLSDSIDYIEPFLDSVYAGGVALEQAPTRALMWTNKTLGQMHVAGRLSADRNGMYIFDGTDGMENCETCKRLKGQIHRYKDWSRKKLVPGVDTDTFDCRGYQCRHRLNKAYGPAVGSF